MAESNTAMDEIEEYLKELSISSDEYIDPDDEYYKTIPDEIKNLEDVMTENGMEGIKQALHENAEKWKAIPINIGVTGCSGAGKSSFINSFLGLSCEDEHAAKVGETETTMELKSYYNKKRPNLKMWDMPGVGTPNHPQGGYLEKVKFDQYDFFLILSQKRFTSEDMWLAIEIQQRKKRFYFIRTCIDNDIASNKRQKPSKHDPESVKNDIREYIIKNLKEAPVVIRDPKVFLVDNLDPNKYDFQDIDRQLLNDCDYLKKESMALSLSNLTAKVLEKKKQVLKKRIPEKAMAIACEVDDPFKVKRMFNEEIQFHAEQFGLDMEAILENKYIQTISSTHVQMFGEWLEEMKSEFRFILTVSYMRRHLLLTEKLFKLLGLNGKNVVHCARLLRFCLFAFQQNIDEMFKISLEVYGVEAQRDILKDVRVQ